MNKLTYRKIQNLLLFVTILAISFAFYFEYAKELQPCSLCLLQRFCAFLFGLLCLFGVFSGRLRYARILAGFQMLFASAGLFFSARQLWLQTWPLDQAAICVPGLDVMMQYFSWNAVLKALFWGTSECGEVTWRWLGLSMPAWSAFYFLLMLVVSGVVFVGISQSLARLEPKS